MDLSVHITHRNSKLQPVADEYYRLDEYAVLLGNDILRMISDVEDLIYTTTGGVQRDEWPDEIWSKYSRLKHKMLDAAGSVKRLPDNLVKGGGGDGTNLQGTPE